MTLTELHTELTTDPAALGYAPYLADGNDQAIADLRNDKTKGFTIVVPVPVPILAGWAAPSIRGKLQLAANDSTNPAYSIALSALDLLRGSSPHLDTVTYATLLTALVSAGISTQAEHDALSRHR
jgi:hypothetical protein